MFCHWGWHEAGPPQATTTQPDDEAESGGGAMAEQVVTGETSDGYHTFNQLYEFRKLYNAALFNEWALEGGGKPFYDVRERAEQWDGPHRTGCGRQTHGSHWWRPGNRREVDTGDPRCRVLRRRLR